MELQIMRLRNDYGYKVEDGLFECLMPTGLTWHLDIPTWEPKASDTYKWCTTCQPASEREVKAYLDWWCQRTFCGPFVRIKEFLYYPHEIKSLLIDEFYCFDGMRIPKEIANKICKVCSLRIS